MIRENRANQITKQEQLTIVIQKLLHEMLLLRIIIDQNQVFLTKKIQEHCKPNALLPAKK
jgi:hypothetical protein